MEMKRASAHVKAANGHLKQQAAMTDDHRNTKENGSNLTNALSSAKTLVEHLVYLD
jgi:hypothetical protein